MIHKKKVAAIAAVAQYLKSEQELPVLPQIHVHGEPARTLKADAPQAAQPFPSNLWGAGGREQQMQMRGLMQMKSFHR
ncbi:MAG: hypothetical protein M0Z56_06735 [Desulfobacteraceae bacterium]|nr:hypothetical protein [Desulfobacteraceae bacterium]